MMNYQEIYKLIKEETPNPGTLEVRRVTVGPL
jgi:hypothetical protein